MANRKKCCWGLSLCTARLLLVVLFAPSLTFAADAPPLCEPWSGKALSIQGKVEISRAGHTRWRILSDQDKLFCPGDRIRVDRRSRAAIQLSNETLISLDEGSSLTFAKEDKEARSWLDLLKGAVHFISRTPRSLNIRTPYVNAGIEGTEFALRVEPDQTRIWVFEGQVSARNAQGSLTLASGEAAVAEKGSAPVRKLVVRPRDAVQWALYYPPVIDYREESYATGPDATAIREALVKYRQGDLPAAFARLDAVPTESRSSRYYDLSAGLLLSVGQVDEARASIDQALALESNDGTAYALQSVISVTQNDNEKALALAQKGAELSPQSPVPQIALSYAHQALFDIEKARQSVEQAVNLAPQDALAWARLAELELSLGYLDRAVAAARKAVDLDPKLARTQTVLGFANLTEIEIEEAKAAFQSAIEFDPADPLPRLGLGLANIRHGDLDEGTKQIETAAILDPDNALIRSYLGKAYYEQKRTGLARTEFTIAKELDPKDPTPWFYDAILKQTENRPVEALRDLQRSIELNDNRAVYRSRLLLDQDEAARSANLGGIYIDLGFQQLGLVEGWKSVNTDPTNYSGHRLLADSYTTLPRHQIARVSELLQSQLLQPINITPIEASLAESSLFILDGAGPSDLSFNEFNPLFNRNQFALKASGVIGEVNTLGDEIVHSGVQGNISYSLSQFYFKSDGFRENNDLEQDIYNAFIQVALTHKSSAQAEFRYRDTESGDLTDFFNEEGIGGFNPDLRRNEKDVSFRIGLHHKLTPHNDFIISAIHQDGDIEVVPKRGDQFSQKLDSRLVEVQHLFHTKNLRFISGLGYFSGDKKTISVIQLQPPILFPGVPPGLLQPIISKSDTHTRHTNFYFYSLNDYFKTITWTLGASTDFYKGGNIDLNISQFNPKIGFMWNPFHATTLRAATFKTLKRTLSTKQTLEPTQVAGFTQHFDHIEGTKTWHYGIGLDHKFSNVLYGGIEFTRRDMSVPLITSAPALDWEENLLRANLSWTPFTWLSLQGGYQYERLERDRDNPGSQLFSSLKTHNFPLEINFFHSSGLRSKLKATYVDQDGVFRVFDPNPIDVPDEDHFWILDASVSYRLPNRLGSIAIEARNLLDKSFKHQNSDVVGVDDDPRIVKPLLSPDRLVFGKINIVFQ